MPQLGDLKETIDRLRQRGLRGVAVIEQVPGEYLAMSLDGTGRVTDPRNWDTHPTPELAVANLCEQLRAAAEQGGKA